MSTVKEKLINTIDVIKAWLNDSKNAKYIRAVVLALTSFFWVHLITGSRKAALIYIVKTVAVSLLKEVLYKRSHILYTLAFWAVTALTVVVSAAATTKGIAWFSVGTWLMVYLLFKKAERMREWIVGSLIPFAMVMYADFLQDTAKSAYRVIFTFDRVTRIGYAIAFVLIAAVTALFVQLFNSKRIGYYVSIGVFGLLSLVNFFVYALTEQPFTLSDINIALTAAGVLNSQQLAAKDWIKFAFGILLLAGLYVIVTLVYKKKEGKKITKRIIPAASLCTLLIVAYLASNWLYSTLLLYNGHVKYGFIGNFYITMNYKISLPNDVEDYLVENEDEEGDHAPNVIIVMNEAFSDLGTTFDLPLTEDPLEYFHSLQKEFPSGVAYSSVKGNNTCSSEWEMLSGTPTALTAKGAMIYQNNNKPMNTLVSLFNGRGYTTVGLHPYYSFGYNRSSFYDSLGFDTTVFMEDMPEDLDTVRGYISDEENYKQLIALYEQNEASGDAPFFCFNITMQNHGGYSKMLLDDVRVEGEKSFPDVNTYLSVLNKSDEALKTLISYFEAVEEDTIILFFGDHQPMINNAFYENIYNKPFSDLKLEELKKVYAVPYLIWANYDLNEDAAPEETSICYLSNTLFEVGDIPKNTWLSLTDEFREEYPIITPIFVKEADGDLKTLNTALSSSQGETNKLLRQYQKYSYGILYGIKE